MAEGNVPAEVQRWQYFLRRQSVPQTGNIDGQFGMKTEAGTKIFQLGAGYLWAAGSVRELVSAANSLGIFWGGHFNNPKDGMHFEISKLPARR